MTSRADCEVLRCARNDQLSFIQRRHPKRRNKLSPRSLVCVADEKASGQQPHTHHVYLLRNLSAGRLSLFDRVTRGLIAGGCGGVVGAGTKLLGEVVFPPRYPGEPIPPAVAVSRFLEWMSGSPLLHEKMTLAVQAFHWSFSIGCAALYGAVVEIFPKAKIGYGLGFGFVLLLLTHETALPYFGFSLPWREIPLKEHLSEIFTHAIFGVSVEMVRRLVRPLLDKLPGMTPAAA